MEFSTLFSKTGIPVSAVAKQLITTPDPVTGVSLKLGFGTKDEAFADACKLCAQDHGFYINDVGVVQQDMTYLPQDPALQTPTYQCCGFTFTGTFNPDGSPATRGEFIPYTSGALRIIDMNPATSSETPTLMYYDMKCQNGGTRTHPVAGGAQTYYCQCIQSIPKATDDVNGMFEGERCTVPMSSFLHTNEVHGNFINSTNKTNAVQQTPMNPPQQRWRRIQQGDHPSPGQDVDLNSGIPLPLIAFAQTTALTTRASIDEAPALTTGASIDEAPVTILLPPASTQHKATVSGQCSKPGDHAITWCKLGTSCQDGCPAPPADPPVSVGAAATTPTRTVDAPNLLAGTTADINFCHQNKGDASCFPGCEAPPPGGNASKGPCTAEPSSFKPAADAYEQCIANGRAMIHQDGVDRNDVSTWSAAQQSSLNQLLASGANTTCSTWDKSNSSAGAGVSSWGAGVHSESSTSVGAVGCEALFETSQALSEYNATLNCTLNSATNCQSTSVCSTQALNAEFNVSGSGDKVNIKQKNTQNVYATANYTNQFTNSFTNTTQQSIQSVINQFNSQMQDFSAQASTPIASGGVSSVPSQGAREFSNIAAAISNITMNAVSNQIDNSQITDVTSAQTMTAKFNVTGNNDTINLTQASSQQLHVSEITQNTINNSFSNATTQLLTAKTTQGNTVNSPFSIVLIAIIGVCLIGAIVAAIFIGKFVVEKGSKIFHHGKKPQIGTPTKAPTITLLINTPGAVKAPAAVQAVPAAPASVQAAPASVPAAPASV